MSDDREIARLYRVNKTIHELVRLTLEHLALESCAQLTDRCSMPTAYARSPTGYALLEAHAQEEARLLTRRLLDLVTLPQGFQVAEDEMKMSYQEFRNNFAPNGSVECVPLASARAWLSSDELVGDTELTTVDTPLLLASRNSLNFWTNSVTDREDSIFVFYSDERKVGVKTMRK
jgi:hypothetical protein